jgi:phosphatidylserine/phosphatidylglycerophosphate/cardiolipin synthase-like enzyme
MHHKVIIIDKAIVITGSYNFTNSAANYNDENVLIIHSHEVAAMYMKEFESVYKKAQEAK